MALSPHNCAEGGCPMCMPTDRYEYHVHDSGNNPIDPELLAEAGRKGWELCGVFARSQGQYGLYYFKKRKVPTWG